MPSVYFYIMTTATLLKVAVVINHVIKIVHLDHQVASYSHGQYQWRQWVL